MGSPTFVDECEIKIRPDKLEEFKAWMNDPPLGTSRAYIDGGINILGCDYREQIRWNSTDKPVKILPNGFILDTELEPNGIWLDLDDWKIVSYWYPACNNFFVELAKFVEGYIIMTCEDFDQQNEIRFEDGKAYFTESFRTHEINEDAEYEEDEDIYGEWEATIKDAIMEKEEIIWK